MSLTEDGRCIACDGAGCLAATRSPVGLRALLSPTLSPHLADATGWLAAPSRDHHFCLRCAARYLVALLTDEPLFPQRLQTSVLQPSEQEK